MFLNRCYDNVEDNYQTKANMDMQNNQNIEMEGCNMNPVYECPKETVCHRQIHHEVKHIVPINTKICNHHIIHHTYEPMYTCCTVEDCCNVFENPCKF